MFTVALLLFLLPGFAEAKLDLKADLGFGGTFAEGAWTPLRVTLENLPESGKPESDARDFRGSVQVHVADYQGQGLEYRQDIELPRQSRKFIEFEIMLAANNPVVVELVDEKGRVELRREVLPSRTSPSFASLRHSIYVVPTVLVLSAPAETVTVPLPLDFPAINLRTVKPEELPSDYKGYDAVRLLIVRGRLSERLKPEQLAALDGWIELGGRLAVMTPRAHLEIRSDPWLAERLGAVPAGVFELTLEELDPGSGPAAALLTRWERRPDAESILWDTPAGPAAVRRRLGAGAVYALGVDPCALGPEELATGAGRRMQALLETLVLAPSREDLRARHLWSTANVDPDFRNVMLLPNLWIVTGLIVLFVVVVGPLNFFILRQRRSLEWAWVTIPGLSTLFFFAVYAYGAAAKGGDQHFAASDILHLSPDSSSGLLLSSQVQFSPRKSRYTLVPPANGVALPLLYYYSDPNNPNAFNLANAFGYQPLGGSPGDVAASALLAQREPGRGDLSIPVEQWKMQFYQSEAPLPVRGGVSGEVRFTDESPVVSLRLRNDTEYPLESCVLYLGELEYPVGSIAVGEAIERTIAPGTGTLNIPVPAPQAAGPGDTFAASADLHIRQGAVQSYPIFPRQNPQRRARLLGRLPGWKNPVSVDPAPEASKTVGMVEVALPVTWSGARKLSTANTLRREIYAVDSLNTQYFDLPDQFCHLRDSSLEVLIGRAWDGPPVSFVGGLARLVFVLHTEDFDVMAYDHVQGRFIPVWESAANPQLTRGAEQSIGIPVTPALVNPIEPTLRLRLVSVPQSASAGGVGAGNIFSANYGVEVRGVDVTMTLAMGLPAAGPAPEGSPQPPPAPAESTEP